ncbi:hypothetical protein A3A76_01435 [Candidatus Woesebacteria bacterium RIFCSPLOWO2_01_FULL_39_23]|uniref:Rhodanese domain-containing protein n=1 Tax=Candidatus Woesebacteria bacterium RIFCSPHIGHO2_01_FULL_40_22 TaxID=1802499 RepID=A0A1F7YGN2_9BACT|nr:MAG: hypothetical protein A2141_04935 [Candidatus Woesebacteria bacterium RBG_16_40_11]OGM26487.1 MAG: hypothetical protein A2628_03030 [Candidatus Woesebacteria bacterium RIFCSPHIGHO2_01_FULL_40_22]OGM37656.1 MAG: hypothetical protein A3E41_05550 [Candidatus Woesebacteria bacterium RIFCSPHIGHO2_12_FULL_38_9]OGM62940.1 MAG: hypothetical protein A3A76_01435 [Candidatus Woesebacteria bacterium RIFCSPLOWO2_01_FULL_39_23]
MKKLKKKQKLLLSKFLTSSFLILFGFILSFTFFKTNVQTLNFLPSISNSVAAINSKDLIKKLENKNFTLINVHTPYEGEIEKTDIFINYDEILASKDKLPQDKNAEIVLYCKTGRMSTEAAATLLNLGYTDVKHLNGGMDAWKKEGGSLIDLSKLPEQVLPQEGFTLPVSWGSLGPRLIQLGVIDQAKFEKVVKMDNTQKEILTKGSDSLITINTQNSQFVVDMLWAVGLGQKSLVYDEGPMGKEYKNKAGNFASTGGWSLAKGSAMAHYNKHDLISLTAEQHKRVMDIAGHVYRPCCGNHTAFPDCNHGMAALAAIEMMVSLNMSDESIYKSVLELNSFWFGSTYMTTATYFARQGISWDKVDAKEVLGAKYSSGQGAAEIAKKVNPLPYESKSGGGCGA